MSPAPRLEGAALRAHPLCRALFSATRELGYRSLTVVGITDRAGMSVEDFHAEFDGLTDLVVRVFVAFTDELKDRAGRAFRSIPAWPDNLRAAAYETARWIRESPDGVWFGMVGVLGAPDMVLVRRQETFIWAARLIDAGRAWANDPGSVPTAAPLIAVGAIAETLRRQQEGTIDEDIVGLVPSLMAAAVRPYLGEAAARAELSIPPPADLRDR